MPILAALKAALALVSGPVSAASPVKWAVADLGLIGNAIRLPLVELSAIHRDTVRRAMQVAGLKLEGQAA